MQSTISGDLCEGLRSHFLAKFSDTVSSFTWCLVTLVGGNADCQGDVGGNLMIRCQAARTRSMYAQAHTDQGHYVMSCCYTFATFRGEYNFPEERYQP